METDLDLNSHRLLNFTKPEFYHYSCLHGSNTGGNLEKPLEEGYFNFHGVENIHYEVFVPNNSIVTNVSVRVLSYRTARLMKITIGKVNPTMYSSNF